MRFAALVICCFALACGSADAYVLDAGTGRFTNPPVGGVRASVPISGSAASYPRVAEMWAAAVRYWGGVPRSCRASGVQFKLSREDSEADPNDTETSAWVYDGELCSMYFNEANTDWPISDENTYAWCTVVVHEMGHMLGLSHSRRKQNMMTGDWIPDQAPECFQFATDGSRYVQRIDDPFYTPSGRRRTAAQRAAYLRKAARETAVEARNVS